MAKCVRLVIISGIHMGWVQVLHGRLKVFLSLIFIYFGLHSKKNKICVIVSRTSS
jgi:predicted ABC-type exoprotein transport system permease subunit